MTKNLRSLLITVTLLTGTFPGMVLYGMEPEDAGNSPSVMEVETATLADHLSSLDTEIMGQIGDYLTWLDIVHLRQVSKDMCKVLSRTYENKPIYLVGNTQSLRRKLEIIQSQDWLKGDIRLNVKDIGNNINQFINWLSQNNNLSGRITALYLFDNQLQVLPATIENLQNLEVLYLSWNQLQVLPATIENLQNLEVLYLSWNQLQGLPATIGNLSNLQELNLCHNQLQTFPETIGNLQNLQWLNLARNPLQELPETIENLRNLQRLDISGNQLHELPETIGNLSNLQKLNLHFNQLQGLPETIGNLRNLQTLNLFNNSLQEEQRNAVRQMLPQARIAF